MSTLKFGTTVLKKLFPAQDTARMDLRMAAKCAAAHAEDLSRTVKHVLNGHGGQNVDDSQTAAQQAK